MKLTWILSICIQIPFFVNGAKILGIFPLASPSHNVIFRKLFVTLAEKGHEVDIVSHFPLDEPLPRYNDLSLRGSAPIFTSNMSISTVGNLNLHQLLEFILVDCGYDTCVTAFNHPVMKNLRYTKKKYDLLITELFSSDCMLGFAHLFKIPVVSVTTSVNLPWGSDRMGNPDNPSYIPTYVSSTGSDMTLYQRVDNTLRLLYSKLIFHFYLTRPSNTLAKEFFGSDLPDLQDLAYNTSLVLINSHFSINYARPVVPNFVEVGGLHIGVPKPLPKDLEEIIRNNKRDVIYLTMGSMVKTESFSEEKLQGMFDALSKMSYTVIWKAVKENFPKGLRFPKNIFFRPWMPQLDVLCHPRTKLFISHGGLLGSQEAIYCGVPRIGIPLFADQELNIGQAQNAGLAIKVDYNNISEQSIFYAVNEILTNKKYAENAEKASKMFKDRPEKPMDTAIYWIEYVIKYRGAPQLRSFGSKLAWYQYYLLDVGLVLISGLTIVVSVIVLLLKLVCKTQTSEKQKQKRS